MSNKKGIYRKYAGIAYLNDKGQKVTESFVIPNNWITTKADKATIKPVELPCMELMSG